MCKSITAFQSSVRLALKASPRRQAYQKIILGTCGPRILALPVGDSVNALFGRFIQQRAGCVIGPVSFPNQRCHAEIFSGLGLALCRIRTFPPIRS